MPKQRDTAAIESSGFVFIRSEGKGQTGLDPSTLWRYIQQGRLNAFGTPLKTRLDHLREQQQKDFPKLGK